MCLQSYSLSSCALSVNTVINTQLYVYSPVVLLNQPGQNAGLILNDAQQLQKGQIVIQKVGGHGRCS